MAGTRKGYGPGFRLSSSNQSIVQTRRLVSALFLLLDAAALGCAAAVLRLRYTPTPLYESDNVVASTLFPVVITAVDGLWVASLLLLDVYYPVTFLSKPIGELAWLIILTIFHLTAALCLYVDLSRTPFSVKPEDNFPFQQQRSFSITALILVLFLLVQTITLAFSLLVVLSSTIRHLRAGRWDALDHPICRYDPTTVPFHRHPLELLQQGPGAFHMPSFTDSVSASRAELIRNMSRESSHDPANEAVLNYRLQDGRTVDGGSSALSQGLTVWEASEARPIPVRGFV